MVEVQNRKSNVPEMGAQAVGQFISSAPALNPSMLGGGLMQECVNLEISQDMLTARKKFKKTGLENIDANLYSPLEPKWFFTIPSQAGLRAFWLFGGLYNAYEARLFARDINNSEWAFVGSLGWLGMFQNGNSFDATQCGIFRLMGGYGGNDFWVLWVKLRDGSIRSWVMENAENTGSISIRPLDFAYRSSLVRSLYSFDTGIYRAYGIDLAEKRSVHGGDEEIVARSLGVIPSSFLGDSSTCAGYFHFRLGSEGEGGFDFPPGITHLRIWLSDVLSVRGEQTPGIGKPTELFCVAEFPIDVLSSDENTTHTLDENAFKFKIYRSPNTNIWEISYSEPSADDSGDYRLARDFSTEMTIEPDSFNGDSMPNALCLWQNRLWGINRKYNLVQYSNPAAGIFGERTSAIMVVNPDIGTLRHLEKTANGVVAFGAGGIARIYTSIDTSIGEIFGSSILSRHRISEHARFSNLDGLGICVFDSGKFLFLDERTLEAGRTLIGLDIGKFLGGYLEGYQYCKSIDGRIYICASSKLYAMDLGKGTGLSEIRVAKDSLSPAGMEISDNGDLFFVFETVQGLPKVLSFDMGENYEDSVEYIASFCHSAVNGFAELLDASVFANIKNRFSIGAELVCDGISAKKSMSIKEPAGWWEYFIPIDKGNGKRVGKTVVAKIAINPKNSQPNYDDDGIEIANVKFTKITQSEALNPDFRS